MPSLTWPHEFSRPTQAKESRRYGNPGDSYTNSSLTLQFTSTPSTIFSSLPPGEVANLRSFNFSGASGLAGAADSLGGSYDGTITSIELVSTPEPSTLVIFAVFGIAVILQRRYRKS